MSEFKVFHLAGQVYRLIVSNIVVDLANAVLPYHSVIAPSPSRLARPLQRVFRLLSRERHRSIAGNRNRALLQENRLQLLSGTAACSSGKRSRIISCGIQVFIAISDVVDVAVVVSRKAQIPDDFSVPDIKSSNMLPVNPVSLPVLEIIPATALCREQNAAKVTERRKPFYESWFLPDNLQGTVINGYITIQQIPVQLAVAIK